MPIARAVREGELLVTENQGRYYQKLAEGDAFTFATPLVGTTLAATHTTATLGATATPVVAIFNGGVFNISVNREFISTLSGTPAGGAWWWFVANGQQASALAALTDVGINAKTLLPDTPSGVKLGLGKALTGLTGSLVPYKPAGNLNTVTAGLGVVDRETAGSIIVAPGQLLALLAPGAGTTHAVHVAIDVTKIEVSA
jgi:hypothetical protein